MKPSHLAFAVLAAVVCLSSIAHTQAVPAETAELQRLRQENASLSMSNADLRRQLAEAQAVAGAAHGNKASVARAQALLAQYRTAAEEQNARALGAGAERDRAIAGLAGMRTVLAACQEKNNRLVDVSREILDAYNHTGFFDSVFSHEPVLGIGQVELENLAQDRSDRIEAGRFTLPPEVAAGAPQPSPKQ